MDRTGKSKDLLQSNIVKKEAKMEGTKGNVCACRYVPWQKGDGLIEVVRCVRVHEYVREREGWSKVRSEYYSTKMKVRGETRMVYVSMRNRKRDPK